MLAYFETVMFISIPESVGLLAFGIAMTATAGFLRGYLSRRDAAHKKEGK